MKYKFYNDAGFTLIELLVVIAIICLLSSIILASVSTARNKGQTGAIKEAMHQMSIQAEVYRLTNGSFGANVTTCSAGVFSDPVIQSQQTEILANAASGATLSCFTDSTGNLWAFSVFPLTTGGSWCIDNGGPGSLGVGSYTAKINLAICH